MTPCTHETGLTEATHKPAHTRHNPQNLADPTFQMFCCDFKKLEKHLSMVAPVKKHFIRKQEGAVNSRVLLFLLLRKKQESIQFNFLWNSMNISLYISFKFVIHVNAISFHMAHFKLQNTHVNAISFHMARFKLIVFVNGLFWKSAT